MKFLVAFLILSLASPALAQQPLPAAPTWYCSTTPPVQPVAPALPLTCDAQVLAAIADLKQTVTDQHAAQTNLLKQFGTFIVNNWPVIVSALGTLATCKASGKC